MLIKPLKISAKFLEVLDRELEFTTQTPVTPILSISKDKSQLLVPVSPQSFIVSFSPQALTTTFLSIRTLEDALNAETPTLATIKKGLGEQVIFPYIQLWLMSLNDSLNVKYKLTGYQVEEISRELYRDYYFLSIAELHVFFRNIKMGKFGDMHGILSPDKFFQWLDKFTNERVNKFEGDNIYKDKDLKSQEYFIDFEIKERKEKKEKDFKDFYANFIKSQNQKPPQNG